MKQRNKVTHHLHTWAAKVQNQDARIHGTDVSKTERNVGQGCIARNIPQLHGEIQRFFREPTNAKILKLRADGPSIASEWSKRGLLRHRKIFCKLFSCSREEESLACLTSTYDRNANGVTLDLQRQDADSRKKDYYE